MRILELNETKNISGGAWCTWNGYPGNGAGNQIWIEGDDCSVLKNSIQTNRGSFDVSGVVMTVVFAWSGAMVGLAAAYAFGLSAIAATGVCVVFAISVGIGYAATHR